MSGKQGALHWRTLSQIPRDELRELYLNAGVSTQSIASRFGVCSHTIRRHLRRHGIARTPGFRALSIQMPEDPGVLGYIAGLFDGEGSIIAKVAPRNPGGIIHVQLVNTYRPVIDWLQETVGGDISGARFTGVRPRKAQYTWRITSARNACAFLQSLIPYLRIKREKAEVTLRWLNDRIGGKEVLP